MMRKKTIIFLHTVYLSANPQQVYSVARAWYYLGYNVIMITPWTNLKTTNEKFRILRIPSFQQGNLRTLCFGIGLIFILPLLFLTYSPVMIYSRKTYIEVIPVWICRKLLRRKFKYILNINGWQITDDTEYTRKHFLSSITDSLYYHAYKLSDYVITVTPELRDTAIRSFHIEKERVLAIRNGCNLELFKPIEKKYALKQLNLDNDLRYLVFSGSFKFWHGLEYGLRIFAKATCYFPDLRMFIVGASYDKQQTHNSVIEMLHSLHLHKKVILTGYVDSTKVPLYIAASEIGLLFHQNLKMMKYGLSPLKLPEYMACKRPVICTNVGGLDEFVKKHDCGLIGKHNDEDDYVQKIVALLKNTKLKNKLAENAYQSAIKEFDWNKIGKKILKFTSIEG